MVEGKGELQLTTELFKKKKSFSLFDSLFFGCLWLAGEIKLLVGQPIVTTLLADVGCKDSTLNQKSKPPRLH